MLCGPLRVTAFVDPAAIGALESLDRHAGEIDEVAVTGLLLGDAGVPLDRLDPAALDVARTHGLRTAAVIQNLDESGGGWDGRRVLRLARDRVARTRLARALSALCLERGLDGVNVDFEELPPDGGDLALVAIVRELSRELRQQGIGLTVDVPAFADARLLAKLGPLVDHVIVMAYDEHDEDAAPGPVASEDYVARASDAAAAALPPGKLTLGLGVYGYDWIDGDPGDPLSFVDAHLAAREAGVVPRWDAASGDTHLRYSDDEGNHEVWLIDAAGLYNQVGRAQTAGVGEVALWRLGGEDPGVWEALAARRSMRAPALLSHIEPDDRVENQGDGPFLSLSLSPSWGTRQLSFDGDRISSERFDALPSPWLVRRAGVVPGKVALSFDDGPDDRYTPRILDLLRAARAPASFFVVGLSAAGSPSLVRRAFAEGHEIGNHTFTHPDVDATSTARLRLELEATSRLVETLIGRRPILYRPPSLKDIEPRTIEGVRAFARAGELGYLVVDADVDPQDWQEHDAVELARRVLDGARDGGVILLHDGGGNRETTVAALPRILEGLKARGLSIVPLAALIGKSRDEVMQPSPARSASTGLATRLVFSGGGVAVAIARALLWCALVAVGLRAVLMLILALVAARRRGRNLAGPIPGVSCVIPAYNEREVIERTVASVLASDVPVEVIVVDDGSTDGTAALVRSSFAGDPRVRLLEQKNAGKAAALRAGFSMAAAEVVVALDGDTQFLPDTVRHLAAPFADPRVAAVAGTCDVGNCRSVLTACQALEYLVQQEIDRRAWDCFGALPVVPGAVGAWRKSAVQAVGGFSSETLAEDSDLAMALCRRGDRVVHAPSARARTEAPDDAAGLIKQRVRWSFGILQSMWKHRAALLEPRAGAFGRIVLPTMILFQVLVPLVTPIALVAALIAAWAGNLGPALLAAAVLFGCEALHLTCALHLAGPAGRRHLRLLLPAALLARAVYRPLLFAVLWRSLGRVLDGVPLGWNKLARRGTVTS